MKKTTEKTCRLCGEKFVPDANEGDDGGSGSLCPQCRSALRPPEESETTRSKQEAVAEEGEKEGREASLSRRAAAARKEAGEAARATAERGPHVGKAFGNYEILDEISRGSFGVVYRARQKGLNRPAALKVLLAGSHASKEAVSRFHREAQAVARLRHPNIVPIYDIGEVNGLPYFAMEFVDGVSLSALTARGPVSVSLALTLGETLADALASAHRAGVIHRDVKPSNILVDAEGEPRLTDFGLAKRMDMDTQYTQAGTTLGTPAYMPPEQARGELDKVREYSDLYALGAVLYELLTGRAPFGGRSLLEVIVAVINEPVLPPRKINPKIHRDVQTIVLKCLEKDPKLRYASAEELRDDLRRFRAGEAIRAVPIGPVRLAGRFLRRHAASVAAAVVAVTALGFAAWYGREQQSKTKQMRKVVNEKDLKLKETVRDAKLREKEKRRRVSREIWSWTAPKPGEKPPAGAAGGGFVRRMIHRSRDYPEIFWDTRRRAYRIRPLDGLLLTAPPRRKGDLTDPVVYGDLEMTLTFGYDPAKAKDGLRIGLQSAGDQTSVRVAFLLELTSGRLRLFGPAEVYRWANRWANVARNRPPPPLKNLAEKQGPKLTAGVYKLKLRREGMDLFFALFDAAGRRLEELKYFTPVLSHWLFKNTRPVICRPPNGFRPLAARLSQITGGDVPKGVSYFLIGDYNGAQTELDATAESTDDRRAGTALYHLGVMWEIYGDLKKAGEYYTEAKNRLGKAPASKEILFIERQIALRRIVRFCLEVRGKKTTEKLVGDVSRELVQARGPNGVIGEPGAWELLPALEALLPEKWETTVGGKKRRLSETEKRVRASTAAELFRNLGLPPGSRRLELVAQRLAVGVLAEDDDVPALIALHEAYPTEILCSAFTQVVVRAAGEKPPTRLRTHAEPAFFYALKHFHSPKNISELNKAAEDFLRACLRVGADKSAAKTLQALPLGITPNLATAWGKALAELSPVVAAREDLSGLWPLLKNFAAKAEPAPKRAKIRPREALRQGVEKLGAALAAAGRPAALRRLYESFPTPSLAPAFAAFVEKNAGGETLEEWRATVELLQWCRDHMNRVVQKTIVKDGKKVVEKTEERALELRPLVQAVEKASDVARCRGADSAKFLMELHSAFPSPVLARAFARECEAAAWQRAGENATTTGEEEAGDGRKESLRLLRYAGRHFAAGVRRSLFRPLAERLARAASSDISQLTALFDAFPAPNLAVVFAERLRALAGDRSEAGRRTALKLLDFCRRRVLPILKDEESRRKQHLPYRTQLEDAVVGLFSAWAVADKYRSYLGLPDLVDTFPLPEAKTVKTFGLVLRNLTASSKESSAEPRRAEDALYLYTRCWVLLPATSCFRFRPFVVAALKRIPAKERTARCEILSRTVLAELPADEVKKKSLWKLEFGDLLTALAQPKAAIAVYETTARDEGVDATLAARAALRADALRYLTAPENEKPENLWTDLCGARLPVVRKIGTFLRGKITKTQLAAARSGGVEDPFKKLPGESRIIYFLHDYNRAAEKEKPQLLRAAVADVGKTAAQTRAWPATFLDLFRNRKNERKAEKHP